MAFFRKIKAGLVKSEIAEYIGEEGNIFFNIDTGELRLSDGITPGGLPIYAQGTGGNGVSLNVIGSVPLQSDLDVAYQGAVGDTLVVQNTGNFWLWDGDQWIDIGVVQAPQGYTGSQGDIGFTGSQGDQGEQGRIGFTGSQGEQGIIGYTGSRGEIGFTGSKGDRGDVGYTGSQGDIGFTGSQGDIGYTGSQGDIGFTGSQGDIGFAGSQGDIGFTGSQGAGFTGSQGDVGYTGSVGFTGSQGAGFTGSQGDVGYTGSVGFTGLQGDIGYTGSQGDVGYAGSVGYTGSQGDIGYTGSFGDTGFVGSLGYTGSKGLQGGAEFIFQNNGFNYSVDGFFDNTYPTLTAVRGQLYYFNLTNVNSSHPLALRLSSGNTSVVPGTTGNNPSSGNFGNGTVSTIVTYQVPFDAPSSIVYQCVFHSSMIGIIEIVDQIGYTGSQGDIGYTGSQGDTGMGFQISKIYLSVADLTADVNPTGILVGEFAVIETGNNDDPENSRLYLWDGTSYSYVTDLSGAVGLTGAKGDTGYTGSAGVDGSVGYTGSFGYTGSRGVEGGQTYVINNPGGAFVYTVNGFSANYPTITAIRGELIYFDLSNITSSHPLAFRLASGNTSAVPGMINNNAAAGQHSTATPVVYRVPYDAPLQIVYQCVFHSGMIGYIDIRDKAGYTGSHGAAGSTGVDGSVGYTGSFGDTGYTGSIGYTGSAVPGMVSNGSGIITIETGYSIVPATDGLQSLGSPTAAWGEIYISGNSIYLGGNVISINADGSLDITDSAGDAIPVRAKNFYIGSVSMPAYTQGTGITGLVFPDGSLQTTSAPKMYTNADAANGLSLSDLKPGDFYYDDINAAIFICYDTGLGYFDILDLTVRAS